MRKLLISLACALVVHVQAQTPAEVHSELSALVKAAFSYSPSVEESRNVEQLAADKVRLTALNNRPDLTMDMSYAYVMPRIEWPINGQKVQFAPVNSLNGSLNASYVLFDFGRQKAAIDLARNELLTAKHLQEATRLGLAFQVASVYYQMLYLKRAIAIQDTVINALKEALRITAIQFKNGTALEIDVLSIRAAIASEEDRKLEWVSQLSKQTVLMTYATGQQSNIISSFEDVTPLVRPGVDTLNPAIQLQLDKWQQSKLELAAAQMRTKPIVSLRGSMGSRNGYLPIVNDLRFNYLAGIGLTVPIYRGGRTRQQVLLQEHQSIQAQLQLNTLKNDLARDLQVATVSLQAAQERTLLGPIQVALATKILDVARSKFQNGTGLYLEIISAGSGLQKALWSQLQAQFQVCLANLEMARLMGTRFWE